jgi:hypothetical protein
MNPKLVRAKRWAVGLAAGVVVVACWGCAGGTPSVSSSSEEASVKGTVTIQGKPASGGQITFDPSNINRKDARLYTTKIGPDGTYELKTLVGENVVSVQGPQIDRVPSLASNELHVDIKSGENTIPVDVK